MVSMLFGWETRIMELSIIIMRSLGVRIRAYGESIDDIIFDERFSLEE